VRRNPSIALLVSLIAWIAPACVGTGQHGPADLAQAQATARQRGVPLLLDFYTDW